MKHGSTLFLKLSVWLMGLSVTAICSFLIIPTVLAGQTEYYAPNLIILCVSALPFLFALFQTLKLLSFIDKNRAFSWRSVKALSAIKFCAFAIALLHGIGLPSVYYAANIDDAPGVLVIALVVVFGALVVAGFAAVLQLLLKSAIEMKKENDLTV